MNRFDDEDSDILGYPLAAYTPDDWAPQMGMNPPAYTILDPTSKTHIAAKKNILQKYCSPERKISLWPQ